MKTKAKNLILGACALVLVALALWGASLPRLGAKAADLVTGANAALALPSSYEQYLSLEAPVDAAFSEDYIAVADGRTLYLYDRAKVAYSAATLSEGRTIAKLGFAGNRLFVSDTGAGNFFYEYDFPSQTLVPYAGINCSTFCIDGDILYTATVSSDTGIYAYSVSALSPSGAIPAAKPLGVIRERNSPSLTVSDGTLYCAFGDRVFYPDVTGQFGTDAFYLASDPATAADVKAVCFHEGTLYYTARDGLYLSNPTTHQSTLLIEGAGFGSLTSYGGALYAVRGNAVHRVSLEGEAALSDYEISAASSSTGRLSGAVDSVRAENILVTADAGNRRISVSEIAETEAGNVIRSTSVIPCVGEDGTPYVPELVATDGDLIAVSSANYIYLYRAHETAYFYRHNADTTDVRGLVCVYGACYYVTEYGYGKAEAGYTAFPRSGNAPKALAADVYGTLYVVCASGSVEAYTETAFLDRDVLHGSPLDITLPAEFTSLRADFEGNLYCLAGNALYKNGDRLRTFGKMSPELQFVYQGADMPLSFALGYEDSEVYLLYGNYFVKTSRLAEIPTLEEIDATGIGESVFAPHGVEGLLLDIPAGTIGVRTDLDLLKDDPACFPYRAYYRTSEATRGVLLAVKDRYALVLVYEIGETSRTFSAVLFRMNGEIAPVATQEYWRAEEAHRYLTDDVSSYDFPCLHTALAETRLARGTAVHVLGYVEAPERRYAFVESEDTAERGFIPAAYLTDIRPVPDAPEVYEPAWLKASKAGVTFRAEDGTERVITERTRAEFVENGDGTYTARIVGEDGKLYTAVVPASMIDRGESDAVRISLIIILTVLAVGIIGGYCYLMPRKKPSAELSSNDAEDK